MAKSSPVRTLHNLDHHHRVLTRCRTVITQCSMRHLYAAASEPGVSYLIDKAKTFERRRCGHLPEEYPEPLSAKECLSAVVDPKSTKHNKHRYCVASQDIEVRKAMRGVLGVPLVYINRSVMIMEPMAEASVETRERGEKSKFRDGLKRGSGSAGMKRKRGEDDEDDKPNAGEEAQKKKKKFGAPKGPNPLAVKKSKKKVTDEGAKVSGKDGDVQKKLDGAATDAPADGSSNADGKKKRRRKHKSAGAGAGDEAPVTTETGDNSS